MCCMDMSSVSFSFSKNDFQQYYATVHPSLNVFVGFTFDKSFNNFVGEGHESVAEFLAIFSGVFFKAT